MARPVNADASATRRRILDEATRMFAERGPARSSIRAIAAEAGVSLGMVHHYFGSKDELYGACVDAMYAELGTLKDELVKDLGSRTAVKPVLKDAITELFRFAREHATAVRLMMRTVVETGELDRERREAVLLPFLEQTSEALSDLTGEPASSYRLPLQSLVFLTGRYAIGSDDELGAVTGLGNPAAAQAAVRDHLIAVASHALGIPLHSTREELAS